MGKGIPSGGSNEWFYDLRLDIRQRPDMVEWLETQRDVGAYLRALVDDDMLRHGAVIRVRETIDKLRMLSVFMPILLCRDDPAAQCLFEGRGSAKRYLILENGETIRAAQSVSELEGAYRAIGTVI